MRASCPEVLDFTVFRLSLSLSHAPLLATTCALSEIVNVQLHGVSESSGSDSSSSSWFSCVFDSPVVILAVGPGETERTESSDGRPPPSPCERVRALRALGTNPEGVMGVVGDIGV